jgi:ParB-like chromosome segregation protein Spo0J
MSNKPSWRKLMDLGVVKRTDAGLWARPSAIRILPGFNLRDTEAPGYRDDIESLKNHKRRGGKVPPLEVSLSKDGLGVDVIDGHRRTTADQELLAEGLNIEWIRIEPFEGNDLERQARILTSQDNRKLLPLELAEGYRRLKAFGLNNEEIGNLVGKSRQHIEQMLLLAAAPHAVQMMVRAGETAATTAIEAVREHGDGAAVVLGQAKQEAAASGKKKVTTAAIRPWTPPTHAVLPMVSAVDAVVLAIPEQVRQALREKPVEDATIELPAAIFYELLAQQESIRVLRAKAEQKSANKATAAAHATGGGDHAD